jgi:HK97 gp10 family phage protein
MKTAAKLDTRVLDAIIAQHQQEAGVIVRGGAFSVAGHAAVKAPYDTGALSTGIKAEEYKGPLVWWAHDAVDYGIYQELGTSKMGAHPFMVPAVETVRPEWNKHWREFFKRWR